MPEPTSQPLPDLSVDGPSDGVLNVRAAGRWTLTTLANADVRLEDLVADTRDVQRLVLDAAGVERWDSGFVTFLLNVESFCAGRQIEFDRKSLPSGLSRLLDLAQAGRRADVHRPSAAAASWLSGIGAEALRAVRSSGAMLGFFGDSCLALGRLLTGRARMRRSDMVLVIEQCGPQALPIVSLISFLIGIIMAFVGAIQLEKFGAQIYVANLVGIAMVRELGPVMTAIVMAGRTGAAFAAQLGTMTVNEEIAALRTFGISSMDFLVLPRMTALILMLPLLTIFANVVGMVGGMLIAGVMLDISSIEYFNQTAASVSLTDWAGGLVKAAVFGVIVAVAGCLRGIQCGRSASDVGVAATSAVATGIVFIIVVDGTSTVFYTVLGI